MQKILIILILAGVLSGCVMNQSQVETKKVRFFKVSAETGLSGEIATIENNVDFTLIEDAKKVLRLAVLMSRDGNGSKPDYGKALELLMQYTTLVPENDREVL